MHRSPARSAPASQLGQAEHAVKSSQSAPRPGSARSAATGPCTPLPDRSRAPGPVYWPPLQYLQATVYSPPQVDERRQRRRLPHHQPAAVQAEVPQLCGAREVGHVPAQRRVAVQVEEQQRAEPGKERQQLAPHAGAVEGHAHHPPAAGVARHAEPAAPQVVVAAGLGVRGPGVEQAAVLKTL
eukprot:COSAG04_NODE_1161_length_8022_cov_6.963019_11_plen_183_part_00